MREVIYAFGPRFCRDGEAVMFSFRIDSTNEIGPRKASADDIARYGAAYDAFCRADDAGQTKPRRGRPPKIKEPD